MRIEYVIPSNFTIACKIYQREQRENQRTSQMKRCTQGFVKLLLVSLKSASSPWCS